MYIYSCVRVAFLFFITYFITESKTAGKSDTCNTFSRDMEMNGRKNKKNLGNFARTMKFEECIKLCATDILCKSIFYHRGNSECESVQHYAAKNTSEIDVGWIYLRKNSCCKLGWLRFRKHCYLFKKGNFTLPEAQALCENEGAYMVEIESFTLQEFLKQKMRKDGMINAWSGGRLHGHGQWKWAHSGKPIVYTKWHPSEPSGDGVAVVYTLYYQEDYWIDIPSHHKTNVICQSDTS